MDFLKAILGDNYSVFDTAIKAYNDDPKNKDKQIKLADIGTGDYVSKSKFDALDATNKELEGQLQTAANELKSLEGVDVNELQGKIAALKEDLDKQKSLHVQQLADRDFNDLLKDAISGVGGRSAKAVMAELDLDTLKSSKNQKNDIKVALETCKKTNGWMFGLSEPIDTAIGATGSPIVGLTKESFAKMGYKERLDLKQKDPTKYEEMRG